MAQSKPLTINGWNIFAHSLFLDQVEELITRVEKLRRKYPADYTRKNATKRLAAIEKLAFEILKSSQRIRRLLIIAREEPSAMITSIGFAQNFSSNIVFFFDITWKAK